MKRHQFFFLLLSLMFLPNVTRSEPSSSDLLDAKALPYEETKKSCYEHSLEFFIEDDLFEKEQTLDKNHPLSQAFQTLLLEPLQNTHHFLSFHPIKDPLKLPGFLKKPLPQSTESIVKILEDPSLEFQSQVHIKNLDTESVSGSVNFMNMDFSLNLCFNNIEVQLSHTTLTASSQQLYKSPHTTLSYQSQSQPLCLTYLTKEFSQKKGSSHITMGLQLQKGLDFDKLLKNFQIKNNEINFHASDKNFVSFLSFTSQKKLGTKLCNKPICQNPSSFYLAGFIEFMKNMVRQFGYKKEQNSLSFFNKTLEVQTQKISDEDGYLLKVLYCEPKTSKEVLP